MSMPDSQMQRLRQLMHKTNQESYLQVILAPVILKKSALKSLSIGDVIPLHTSTMELLLLDKETIIAKAEYGVLEKKPAIYISSIETNIQLPNFQKQKKYKQITLSFGKIKKEKLAENSTIAIEKTSFYDIELYDKEHLIAEANLVILESGVGLCVERVE